MLVVGMIHQEVGIGGDHPFGLNEPGAAFDLLQFLLVLYLDVEFGADNAFFGLIQVVELHPYQIIDIRSEEHTSELQSLMRTSYAVFCLTQHKNSITSHKHKK